MTKEGIGLKLKEYRIAAGLTQVDVSAKISRPQQTITSWEKGRSQPDANTLLTLLRLYSVSPNTFFGYDVTSIDVSADESHLIETYRSLDDWGKKLVKLVASEVSTRCVSVPFSSTDITNNCIMLRLSDQPASAGKGVYLGPEAFTDIKVQNRPETCDADFVIRVSGDSMEPKYHDGDYLLIKSGEVSIGDIALVTLDGEGYIKRIGDGVLTSLNNHYKPIPLNDSVRVNGRVIGVLKPEWILG